MMKKITLVSLTTMALLFIPGHAEGMKCKAGKCGAEKIEKSCDKGKSCNKKNQKSKASALLIPLPSVMRWIVKHENDATLALRPEQKSKLEAQRKDMMPKMMDFKKEIKALQKEIKGACKKSESAAQQKDRVQKLAQLKTEATMMKLTCIEGVKTTLSKEQWATLKGLRKSQKGQTKAMKKAMKCQAGKCGSK